MIDTRSDSVVAQWRAGERPWGIDLSADGRKLYTANGPSNDVSVIDASTGALLKTIPVGKVPWGVAVER